ncbi:MAG: PSD1 and planctomycete cytochrome C domain-containing protein, partial [Verrucomicrobiota bacterium]|nr:PSD1 and planctomycete cytochrome C domain-containing protein [Verrucomicrobiota bacterium]
LFAAPPDYVKDIKPLLRNKCSSCHGAKKQKSKLRLDAGKFIHAGSKEGEVIVPGKANTSELITRVLSHDEEERMPPEGAPLTAEQVAQLQAWINAGAKFPADEVIASAPKEHWAYQPVKRPELPKVKNRDWTTNPIDYFILAKLEAKGWRSNPSAKPFQLLRRAHLDITGLPPTLKEQENFAKDPDLPRLIDNLLARKGYGERYARHWLDVVRYADTNGYERDGAKPQVWRYRDYVIRALNSDKPFNRFLLEQLAGDELPDSNTETVIATGFHRLGPWDDEPADFAVDRFDQLDDIINTTSQAFLGLTMGCARCHEHKFDPFTQEDYYSMVAIFNPLKRPQAGRTEKTRYATVPALAAKLETRDKTIAIERAAIKKTRTDFMLGFLRDNRSKLPTEVQLAFLVNEPKRNNDQKKRVIDNQSKLDAELNAALPADLKKKITAHESTIAKLRKETPDMPQGYFLHEPSPKAPETRLLKRGNPKTPGEVMEPAVPVILTGGPVDFLAPTKHTTRRRFTLARWMARPNNPLTARVIVNRAWQWHFGQGIVRTPNDFGLIGERPTHPALLDWMAHWFVHDANWSLKKLHRLIMTSSTWQMSRET